MPSKFSLKRIACRADWCVGTEFQKVIPGQSFYHCFSVIFVECVSCRSYINFICFKKVKIFGSFVRIIEAIYREDFDFMILSSAI